MEPFSFPPGTLSVIHQVISAAQQRKQRWDTSPNYTQTQTENFQVVLEDILDIYQDLEALVQDVKLSFHGSTRLFRKEDADQFDRDFSELREMCRETAAQLENLDINNQEDHGLHRQQQHDDHATNSTLSVLRKDATRAKNTARLYAHRINNVSVTEIVSPQKTGTILDHIERQTDLFSEGLEIIDVNTEESSSRNAASNRSSIRRDEFKPTFLVQRNPPNVVLDYDTLDTQNNPVTLECQLKHAILSPNTTNEQCKRRFACATASSLPGAEGMGGVGKSCALRGLITCPDVCNAFPGGIYFMSFEMHMRADRIPAEIAQIVRLSGGHSVANSIAASKSIDKAVTAAAQWFSKAGPDKPCLFLIDDVWLRNGISADTLLSLSRLTLCNESSSFCFSTRFSELAGLVGNRSQRAVTFNTLDPVSKLARTVLLNHAAIRESDVCRDHEDAITSILHACNGLKVALTVAGGSVKVLGKRNRSRTFNPWSDFVQRIEDRDVNIVKSKGGMGGRLTGYRSLLEMIPIALDVVQEHLLQMEVQQSLSMHQLFRSLCIMPKQKVLVSKWLWKMWNEIGTHQDIMDVITCLEQVGLLNYDEFGFCQVVANRRVYSSCAHLRMHDLIHDYICEEAVRHEGVAYWHEQLLQGLVPGKEMWTVEKWEEYGQQWCDRAVSQYECPCSANIITLLRDADNHQLADALQTHGQIKLKNTNRPSFPIVPFASVNSPRDYNTGVEDGIHSDKPFRTDDEDTDVERERVSERHHNRVENVQLFGSRSFVFSPNSLTPPLSTDDKSSSSGYATGEDLGRLLNSQSYICLTHANTANYERFCDDSEGYESSYSYGPSTAHSIDVPSARGDDDDASSSDTHSTSGRSFFGGDDSNFEHVAPSVHHSTNVYIHYPQPQSLCPLHVNRVIPRSVSVPESSRLNGTTGESVNGHGRKQQRDTATLPMPDFYPQPEDNTGGKFGGWKPSARHRAPKIAGVQVTPSSRMVRFKEIQTYI